MAEFEKNELKKYFGVFYKRRFLFFIIFFVLTTFVTIASYLLPEVYESNALIMVEKQKIIKSIIGNDIFRDEMKNKVVTFKERIISTNNLLDIIKKLDLDVTLTKPGELENLVKKMRGNIDVVVKGMNLFEISYEDKSPKLAVSVTRALTDNFIESTLSEARNQSYSAFDFINGMVDQYKKNLEDSGKVLQEFKKKNISDLPGEVNSYLARLSQYESFVTETELALKIAELKKKKIEEELKKEKPFVDSMGDKESRIQYLEGKLQQLKLTYTDKYPEVQKLKKEIEREKNTKSDEADGGMSVNPETSMPNPVYQKLKESLGELSLEIASLKSKLKSYQDKVADYYEKAKQMPAQEQEYTKILRDYKVNEEIYQMLLRRLEEARISKELQADEEGEKYRVVDPPREAVNPIKPNRARIILLGLLFGFAAGLGIVFSLEYMDHSIKDLYDARDFFKYPILGTIPAIVIEEDVKKTRKIDIAGALLVMFYVAMLVFLILREFVRYNP